MDLIRYLKPAQLRLILKIAETGQLQTAASSLALSQPAASRTLADIEDRVGAPLFDRHPKGMTVTAVGAAFVHHAHAILAEFLDLQAEIHGLKMGQLGRVRIGSVTGPALGCVVPAAGAVKQHAPAIELTIEEGPSAQLIKGLEEDRLDFVLARLPAHYDSRDFLMHPAKQEIVTLVVNQKHPLIGQGVLNLLKLADYDWVIQERGSPIRQAVETAFHEVGVPAPRRVTNSSSLLVAIAMLNQAHVIAPLSAEVAAMLTTGIASQRFETLQLDRQIAVAPYFVIRNRSKQLSRAASIVLAEILSRL